ncbi:methyltransferase domain-containing protein [Kitasatospora sp. NPDC047058]|uniref:methyltransferase domain-containing protein n=1 Tax=Kitasatospora sp. NPDC047058 TaxID=3155620 RepID=UPI003402CF0E
MAEYKLFAGDVPHVSTAAFHADRERAPHLEQPIHRPRLEKAAELVLVAAERLPEADRTVSDLGCGDGGLLSLLQAAGLACWGYDFQPSNRAGWQERGVRAFPLDAFGADRNLVSPGTVAVCTEVLEHLADPHEAVRWIGGTARFLVASSPWNETPASHDECHAWAWDHDGYRALIEQGGYQVLRHETVGQFQIILGERR